MELHTDDKEARERAFKEAKLSGEQMVHRLRNWEAGDILWGYSTSNPNGGSMGKTFRRERGSISDLRDAEAHEDARSAYEAAVERAGEGTAVFLFAARIDSTRTAPRGPDPGEPPLKFAEFSECVVFDSHFETEEGE